MAWCTVRSLLSRGLRCSAPLSSMGAAPEIAGKFVTCRSASGTSDSFARAASSLQLPSFEDDAYAGPEPRVAAHLLGKPVKLQHLRERLLELGCPTGMWQGQVLLCGSSAALGQQRCSAVILPDGCVICWHMSRKTEHIILELAAGCPANRRTPTSLGALNLVLEGHLQPSADGEPIASETMEVVDARNGAVTKIDKEDGCIHLTSNPEERGSDQLAVSLGMAVAVRLEALEKKIERQLEADWQALQKETRKLRHMMLNLSNISHRIFVDENMIHSMRYELNAQAGLLDPPELLWEHAPAERLYDKVVAHFDVRRRTSLLNERLSYSLDYLHTLGEHMRHLHSVRLERMIIVLITFELGVGVMGLYAGFSPHAPPTAIQTAETSPAAAK
eukprot:TRINITY_DN42173_c0_g1_i1.p1 TRINITY_DN42173_c0_g1~~TRINITY_DN42173_c0_g1_i1.p1  ORF type:complete len:389 (-),score=70.26 TRINITY_DN42173_c0_g1_i1:24-1190(-)